MYSYTASVVRVIDGDTVVLDVDLGFRTWLRGQTFRLAGVNARELYQSGGMQARDNLAALLPAGTGVLVHSVRNDKYGGRFDASITLGGAAPGDLAALLVAEGWAAVWNGTGSRPVPPWPRPLTQ